MVDPSAITVRITDWHDQAGSDLRARQLEEILADIEGEAAEGTAPSAADIQVVIVLEMGGVAVATAGLRALPRAIHTSECSAEVKRMFVVPEQRGGRLGVTSLLMNEIEKLAKEARYTTLKLATGTRMHRARAFYEKHGFVQVPLFGPYLTTTSTICYAKTLK